MSCQQSVLFKSHHPQKLILDPLGTEITAFIIRLQEKGPSPQLPLKTKLTQVVIFF